MRKLLVVKVGSTFEWLRSAKGDFEDWIVRGLKVNGSRVHVLDVRKHEGFPPWEAVCGVVVTGSHAMVTDHHDWSERTAAWLKGAVDRNLPVLGICYGHQLLAYALGGTVGDNPRGMEFGTVLVSLEPEAAGDPLFAGLPRRFDAHVSHTQSVLRLPPGARRLACSAGEPNQAFVVGDRAWGVQFHPEFDATVVIEYIKTSREPLEVQGVNVDALAAAVRETPHAAQVLERFSRLVPDCRDDSA
jgi:GMP synthase (glutamine-hydrolysing)